MTGKLERLLVAAAFSVAAVAAAWAAPEGQPRTGGAPTPVISKPLKGDQCVEDTEYMRRNHMKVLNHHRDETVLKGIRTRNHSLKGCIECHASETTGSVAAAKDDFCVSCHSYASVKIDCFDCHSTKPKGPVAMHSLNAGTAHYKHKLAAQATREISAEEMAGIAQ